jgi:nitrite reductase (NADH) small subunit
MSDTQERAAAEHVVANKNEIKPGEHKIVRIRSLEIGIYNVGGTFYALHSMCPHQFGPACAGQVTGESICSEETGWHIQWARDGEILVCPWHGMQFEIATGQCLSKKEMRLRTFPVKIVDDEVRVQLGGRRATTAA